MTKNKKTLNILVLSWRGPGHPLAGGAEQVTMEHLKYWVQSGHNVTLFSSSFPGAKYKETISGINIVRRGNEILGVHILAFFWYFWGKHEDYDLVVDEFHGSPFFTPLYVRGKKMAVIHEVAREVWLLNRLAFPLNYIIGVIGYLCEPFFFKLYDGIPFLTSSMSTKKDLIKYGVKSNKIHIVNNGVIVENIGMYRKNKIQTFVYLGVITRDKGIEDALKVFSILKSFGKYNFWVIGRAENEKYYRKVMQITNSLGLSGKVIFHGFVSQERKFELLSQSHVLVNPSVREGWGLVNIEANAVGTPVVGYKVHGLVDSVVNRKTGLLCDFRDTKSLAENALKLATKPYHARYSREAIRWSKKFDWAVSTKDSLNLVESII